MARPAVIRAPAGAAFAQNFWELIPPVPEPARAALPQKLWDSLAAILKLLVGEF